MRYIVRLGYKEFEFSLLKAACKFASTAKEYTIDKDLSVEIFIEQDLKYQEENQEE